MARILVDICHPAHVHFFKGPMSYWSTMGHELHVTSRDKDVAIGLLDALDIDHTPLGNKATTLGGLGVELITRNFSLIRQINRVRADIAVGLGGTFAAQSSFFSRIPSVVFYDTEIAKLQNRITYPFATKVVVPNCYTGWTPKDKTIRYTGYHELSYLRPNRFSPSMSRAIRAGLSPSKPTYLVRIVSWTSNHDAGVKGLTHDLIHETLKRLLHHGKVIISSEAKLPPSMDKYLYTGSAIDIHHLMAFCSGFFGESATMASECAVLGIPSVHISRTFRGYTDEQESTYGLVKNIKTLNKTSVIDGVEWLLSANREACSQARARMLRNCDDVAKFSADVVIDTMKSHSRPLCP